MDRLLTDGADDAVVLLAYNHPSGNLEPSQEDIAVTKQFKTAGEAVGATLLDSASPDLLPAIRRVLAGDVALSDRMLGLMPESLCASMPAL